MAEVRVVLLLFGLLLMLWVAIVVGLLIWLVGPSATTEADDFHRLMKKLDPDFLIVQDRPQADWDFINVEEIQVVNQQRATDRKTTE